MPSATPYFRESGSGPAVVCLHASVSSSAQWRTFMERLAPRFRVIAVDLYGSGRTPAWPGDRPMRLDDEVDLLEPAFRAAGDRFHLVGHSYGGAVALKAAFLCRSRVMSLALYEPVLFSALMADAPESPAAREIRAVRDDTIRLTDHGDLHAAAARFIDYWMGVGAWAAVPDDRKPALAAAMGSVKPQWHAAFNEHTPLHAFAALDMPTLLMTGSESPASARAVARLLKCMLPWVHEEELDGVGHMGPVTHPSRVNPLIERFLDAAAAPPAGRRVEQHAAVAAL
jgi:pimeloyl-ACP methyl ester carboxylesterase